MVEIQNVEIHKYLFHLYRNFVLNIYSFNVHLDIIKVLLFHQRMHYVFV